MFAFSKFNPPLNAAINAKIEFTLKLWKKKKLFIELNLLKLGLLLSKSEYSYALFTHALKVNWIKLCIIHSWIKSE